MRFEYLGKISTVVGLIFLPATIYSNFTQDRTKTWICGICCAIAFVIALIWILRSFLMGHKSVLYRWLKYRLEDKRGHVLKSRELTYRYTDREHIEHSKKFAVVDNSKGLEAFTDRYVYSGGTACTLRSTHDGQYITNQYRDHGWNFYSIKLDSPAPKGKVVNMGMKMDTIVDLEHKAMPFLSTGIYEPTEKLKMEVSFGEGLVPQNPKLKIFRDYVDRFPIDEEDLTFDYEKHSLSYELKYPVYHYKYMIAWTF